MSILNNEPFPQIGDMLLDPVIVGMEVFEPAPAESKTWKENSLVEDL